MGTFGETLRQARDELGATLAEAERETRINRRYLAALENEDELALPGGVYTRGFIRTYSLYLGLDPDGMLELFGPREALDDRVDIRPIPADAWRARRISFRPVVTIGGLVLLGLLAVYLWGQYTSLKENVGQLDAAPPPRGLGTPPALARGPAPAPSPSLGGPPILAVGSPSPAPAPVPESALVVEARVVEKTWLEVWVDGKSVMAETTQPGYAKAFNADQQVRMRVGNAAGIEVVVNGSTQGPLGGRGQAVDAIWGRQ
jgi:transcriptional regulator with XRE-family HTH domain